MTPEMKRDMPLVIEFRDRLYSGEGWCDSPIRKRYFTWYGPIVAFAKWLWFPF